MFYFLNNRPQVAMTRLDQLTVFHKIWAVSKNLYNMPRKATFLYIVGLSQKQPSVKMSTS